jgi:octaprenyl-diphosphate synthase
MNKSDLASIQQTLKQHKDLRELYANIQGDLEKVEETLKQFAESPNKIISEISGYLFRRSGKRLRPALLMLSSRIFDYRGDEHILLSALVETIHTASLIHDDIIDNSEIRRGQDTVHIRWGPNITVLLGDYLYIQTIARSLGTSRPEYIRILTDVSSEMIEGELHEYYMSGNLELSEEDYLGIIAKKTAALFAASCRMGALLGDAATDLEQTMADYGMALGMSFQIIDDLLDYTGDYKKLGKPVLSDLSEGRITLPLINTLNQSNDGVRARLTELFQNKEQDPQAKNKILEIVRSNGALDYTYQQAFAYTRKAQSLAESLPSSMYLDSLKRIPDYVLYRKK